jgi:hypothetical protein
MKRIPDDITVDGTTIHVKFGDLNMPMSDEMIKKYNGGHLPKTEIRAKMMVKKLRGKVLEFPNNISFGNRRDKIKTLKGWRDGPEKRDERIARRKRRESGLVKVSIDVELEEDYDDREISLALLQIEGVEKVKSVNERQLVFQLKKEKAMTQKIFEEKIYPEIKKKLTKHVAKFKGHDFGDIR